MQPMMQLEGPREDAMTDYDRGLFRRDYDLGFGYALDKMYQAEGAVPSEIGATAARFAKFSQTRASLAFAAGMCDAAIALAQA